MASVPTLVALSQRSMQHALSVPRLALPPLPQQAALSVLGDVVGVGVGAPRQLDDTDSYMAAMPPFHSQAVLPVRVARAHACAR